MPATQQKKKTTANELNISDIFFYLLRRWPWFVISVVVFVAIAFYNYGKAQRVYEKSSLIYIKDPASKTTTASFDRYDNSINKVNVTSEIYRFRSKNLIYEVVKRIHGNVSYTIPEGLHTKELYTQSPVNVTFLGDSDDASLSFKLTTKDSKTVELSDISTGESSFRVALNDTTSLKGWRFVVAPTNYYPQDKFGESIQVTKVPVSSMVGYFIGNLGIKQQQDDASILNISVRDSSPLRATEFLNMLVTVYNEEAIKEKNMVAVNTSNFIKERLAIIEEELGGVEGDIEDFRRSNQIAMTMSEAASQYSSDSRQYSAEVSDIDNQIQMAKYVKEYLADPSKDMDLIPSNTGIGNAAIESQISQYNSLRLRRNKLAEDGGETNPVVQEVTNSMRSLKQSIIRAVDNYITDLGVRRSDLSGRESRANVQMASVPTKERQLVSLERQQQIKEQLYLFLLNRREENELSQAMADNNAKVLNSPEGSNAPVSPSRNKLLLLGLLIGLAIPGIFFVIQMFLDTKVHTKYDIKQVTNIPFLGEIPFNKELEKARKEGKVLIPVKDDPDGIIAEAFSILRTNMHFIRHDGHAVKVVTLTSFNSGAGKTFVSSNLAMSIARTGKKIVIVDLDIRKASLSRLFKCKKVGVTNFLTDPSLTVDDVLQKDGLYNEVDMIAAGPVAPNPAELLMDSRLDDMIEALKSRYDVILVDNVPIGIVADAKISNRIADLTLFIGRSGNLDKRQLDDLDEIYTNKEMVNLAFVFNGTEIRSLGYNNYGHYGYGYGYGYGRYGYGHYGYGSKDGYYGEDGGKKKSHHHHHSKETKSNDEAKA